MDTHAKVTVEALVTERDSTAFPPPLPGGVRLVKEGEAKSGSLIKVE